MANIEDRYLEPGTAYNHGKGRIPDLRYGGQFGYAPDLSEIISTTPKVPRDSVTLITRYPGMYDLFEQPDVYKSLLKYLIEVHPQSITGFDATVTLNTVDKVIDPSGTVMKIINDGSITHSDITVTYPMDYEHDPIVNFWADYIRVGVWDPTVKRPLISTLGLEKLPSDWSLDMYSFDTITFVPNIHFKTVTRAWEIIGMIPLGSGPITAEKDPLNAKPVDELQYKFTGADVSNLGAVIAAQKILDEINLAKANPYTVKSNLTAEELSEVSSGKGGYFETIQKVKDRQIE